MAHIVLDARIINSTTGRYMERLLHHLQDIDTTNHYSVLLLAKDVDYWKPRRDNFTVVIADFAQYSFAEQIGLKRLLDTLSPDLVHFMMPQQPILYSGTHVTTIHDLTLLRTYNSDKNWLLYRTKQLVGWFVFKQVIRSSVAIITCAEYTKQELARFSKESVNKTTAIHLAAEQTSTSVRAYQLPFKRYIMYVGQQSDYKNIPRLAAAHQKLLDSHPDLGLVLVGKKNVSIRQNEALFTKQSYKNIHFTDFVADDQLAWLYQNTECYVFPSLMEGFGLPSLEAMGYGAPVASSDATCLPEINGDAAHYFNPLDVDDMARAISDVLDDSKRRASMIELGYKQFKKYSWRKTAQQTHAVYLNALRSKN